MNCKYCEEPIPTLRIEALKGKCDTCVKCSDAKRIGAFPVITGKNSYSELAFTDMETASRVIKRMNRAGQSPSTAMKNGLKL